MRQDVRNCYSEHQLAFIAIRKDHQPHQTHKTLRQYPILGDIEDLGAIQLGKSMPTWPIRFIFCTFVPQQAFLRAISGHLGAFPRYMGPDSLSTPPHHQVMYPEERFMTTILVGNSNSSGSPEKTVFLWRIVGIQSNFSRGHIISPTTASN